MRALSIALAAMALAAAGPSLAQDAGSASGHYTGDGAKLSFAHAVVLGQDDAEGLLDHGPQVRVLLSQEEVPVAALYGIAFPPVRKMAQAGKVHGVLLEFSPADKTSMQVTVLSPPAEAGEFLHSLSLTKSSGLWKRLDASPTRVSADYDGGGEPDLVFSFAATVQTDPVEADLKGADAQASEPVKLLIARAQAMAKGDLAAAKALSASTSQFQEIPPQVVKQVAAEVPSIIKQYKAAKRVVIRKETASVLLDGHSWASLVREDGVWKIAD
jgi:hypothetical protein